MKPALAAYVSVVSVLGLAILAFDLRILLDLWQDSAHLLADMGLWMALILFVSHFHIVSRSGQAISTLNSAFDYCLILTFGPQFAGLAVAINSLYLNLVRRRAVWYKALFNMSQLVIAVNAAGGLYHLVGGRWGAVPDFGDPLTYLRLPALLLAFSFFNLLQVSLAVRLDAGIPLKSQMKISHYYERWGNSILFYLGALLSALYLQLGWIGVALGSVPLAWVYSYLKRYNELKEMHQTLDQTHKRLEVQQDELRTSNLALGAANRDLQVKQEALAAQAAELERANLEQLRINEDLTRTREGLVRAEKLKAMGQMAGGVAHDFNNILGAIIARSELLKLEPLPDRVREGLQLIHKSALDGAAVVRRIQDFSRVTEHRDFEAVDLGELIDDVLEMTRPLWRDKSQRLGITYEIRREYGPGLLVQGNASELREVLHNLILNALDAMPAGGGLRLAAERFGDAARLQVVDSGHGMSEEVLERLFDPFFTTKGARGNGLGLSVSYGIIERHGGRIEVASRLGAGSTFTIHLPLAAPGSARRAEMAPQGVEALRSSASRRVLVVDDEREVRMVLVDILRLMGHQVDEADSGQLGIERWLDQRHDLVFTDLGMPGLNGWDVADRIRGEAPPGEPQIVLVTGWGAQIKPADLERHAVDRILAKPFRIEQLQQMMTDLSACQS
jgi:signal transduction histidine kinase/ActR/RegA family two-component response regulator